MEQHYSFLRKLLLFGLFCAMAYPAMLVCWSAMLPSKYMRNLKYPMGGFGHMHTRIHKLEKHGPVDVVFIGSSHAYRGFDPRIWEQRGFSAYNLGSSAQTPLQSEVLVRNNLSALDPGIVILEVHPGPFMDEGVESSLDLIANRPIDGTTVCMALRIPHAMTLNALAYGSMRQLLRYDKNYTEAEYKDHDRYVGSGYVERDLQHFKAPGSIKSRPADVLPAQLAAFERMLAALKSQGREVLLIEAPMTHWMYANGYTGQREFEALMASHGCFINMNGKVELNDSTHFFTKGHLNQLGVARFNEALIDTLEARGWLMPVRQLP